MIRVTSYFPCLPADQLMIPALDFACSDAVPLQTCYGVQHNHPTNPRSSTSAAPNTLPLTCTSSPSPSYDKRAGTSTPTTPSGSCSTAPAAWHQRAPCASTAARAVSGESLGVPGAFCTWASQDSTSSHMAPVIMQAHAMPCISVRSAFKCSWLLAASPNMLKQAAGVRIVSRCETA